MRRPLATMTAVFVGGIVRRLVEARPNASSQHGILCASGLVAGEGLAGVVLAAIEFWKT